MSQFESYSLDELVSMRSELDGVIKRKRAEAKSELVAEFRKKAEALGLDFNEIVSSPSKSRAVKYRDPNKKSNTWTGQGRKPKWLQSALDAGASLSDFEVWPSQQTPSQKPLSAPENVSGRLSDLILARTLKIGPMPFFTPSWYWGWENLGIEGIWKRENNNKRFVVF